MDNIITQVTGRQFLQEPIWKWFIFLGALILMNVAWADIISWMK